MSWINGGKVPGTKLPGSESSQELSFPGAKGPAISLLGAKWPGSEWAKERKGQGANWPGPIGRFAPGSEWAWERKGCESSDVVNLCDCCSGQLHCSSVNQWPSKYSMATSNMHIRHGKKGAIAHTSSIWRERRYCAQKNFWPAFPAPTQLLIVRVLPKKRSPYRPYLF